MENVLHPDAIAEAMNVALGAIAPFDDVPARVTEPIHVASMSPISWAALDDERGENVGNAKRWLNHDTADRMTAVRLAYQRRVRVRNNRIGIQND